MSQVKVSDLPAATSLATSDSLVANNSGVTKKATFDLIPFSTSEISTEAQRATRTLKAKLSETSLAFKDALNSDGNAVAGNDTQDDTTGIQRVIDATLDSGTGFYHGQIDIGNDTHKITSNVDVRADSRGLTIQGQGNRASVLHNTDTAGKDSLRVGDLAGNTNYSVTLDNFKVEGNGSDGIGFRIYNTLHSCFTNLFSEFTGQHGFKIQTAYQNVFKGLKARRAGYNGGAGTADVAGFHATGNVAHIEDAVAEECAVGFIGVDGGFDTTGLDTESNILGGVSIEATTDDASNFTSRRGYSENTTGDNHWRIGDGVGWISFARLLGGSMGSAANYILTKVRHYVIADTIFSTVDGHIQADANSKGRIRNIWSTSLDSHASKRFSYTHNPDAAHTGNLIRNGSFEHGHEDYAYGAWTPNANGATATPSFVAGLGHDKGSKALQFVVAVTGAGGGYLFSPSTLPTLRSGYVYTLGISFTATVSGLQVNITHNSVAHYSSFELGSAASAKRMYLSFKPSAAGQPSTFNIAFNGVGTFVIDAITLHEGIDPLDPDMAIDDAGLETCFYHDVLAASTTHVNAATQAYSNDTSFAAQPDVPRNLTFTGSAGAAAGTITVTGMDWRMQATTETVTITGGAVTDAGNVAWMRVMKIDGYDAGAGQTLSVGIGLKLGLPKSATYITKVKLNTADIADGSVTATLNTTYNTVAMSAITGGDDFTFWYIH